MTQEYVDKYAAWIEQVVAPAGNKTEEVLVSALLNEIRFMVDLDKVLGNLTSEERLSVCKMLATATKTG